MQNVPFTLYIIINSNEIDIVEMGNRCCYKNTELTFLKIIGFIIVKYVPKYISVLKTKTSAVI